MIKANGYEHCSACGGGVSHGDDLLEGSAATDDGGALYHPDCYFDLCRDESRGGEDSDA